MDSWFSIENDDMVPTWLFGENRRTAPVNPNAQENMMPTWLRDKKTYEATTSKPPETGRGSTSSAAGPDPSSHRGSTSSSSEPGPSTRRLSTSSSSEPGPSTRRLSTNSGGSQSGTSTKDKKRGSNGSTGSANGNMSVSRRSVEVESVARITGDDIIETKDGRIPAFTLYSYPHSFYCQKILMTLYEKDIPFVEELVNIYLGDQYRDEFLQMNPKAEVPVIKDRENGTVVADSLLITLYLEEFSSRFSRARKVLPEVEIWKQAHEEYQTMINGLNIDALTYGSVMYDAKILQITPNYPYNYEKARIQLREEIQNRESILRSQAARVQETLPEAYAALTKKLAQLEAEKALVLDPEAYAGVILDVERVLDECEAQLQIQFERDHKFWLVCPFISQADISLAILLFRLWQLGFESRMWSKTTRPQIDRFFRRMRKVRSFQKSTGIDEPRVIWPYLLGAFGCVLLFAVEAFIRK